MKKILIYGPGCAKCKALTEIAKQAVNELGLSIPVEKVTDVMQFTVAGVLVTPALAVDGKILISGKVPSQDDVKRILQEALGNGDPQEKGCDCGGCCSSAPKGKSGWKKAVVCVAIVLILLAVVKMINRQESTSVSDVAAALSLTNGVEVVYYEYGARCITCIRMEKWTEEVLHKDFSSELKDGRLSFHAVPADEAAVEKYGLTTKSLIVKKWQNGKEMRWANLNQIWDFSGDEAAFKAYVADSIQKQLEGAK